MSLLLIALGVFVIAVYAINFALARAAGRGE